ncbi:MAG TPA: excinuclease ABC subunit C, partial [Flavobacteriaceae bacterium]|nr:excinuclease ABC subunit C [Flavobacteriaceae bacterium]
YILYSDKLDKYYKGYTNSISERLKRHNAGYEKYTRYGTPWKLILTIEKPTKSDAIILESKLKNLNRERLELFIFKYQNSNPDD